MSRSRRGGATVSPCRGRPTMCRGCARPGSPARRGASRRRPRTGQRIGLGRGPLALAPAAEVERDAAVAAAESLGQAIEGVTLLREPVEREKDRGLARPPVLPMEPYAVDRHPFVTIHGAPIWPWMLYGVKPGHASRQGDPSMKVGITIE